MKNGKKYTFLIAVLIALLLLALATFMPGFMSGFFPLQIMLLVMWLWLPAALIYLIYKFLTKPKVSPQTTSQPSAPWQPRQGVVDPVQITIITILLLVATLPLLFIPFAWTVVFWIWIPILLVGAVIMKLNSSSHNSRTIWADTVYPGFIAFGIFFMAAWAAGAGNPNAPINGSGVWVLSLFIVPSLFMLANIAAQLMNWSGGKVNPARAASPITVTPQNNDVQPTQPDTNEKVDSQDEVNPPVEKTE